MPDLDSFFNQFMFGLGIAGTALEVFSLGGTCGYHLNYAKNTQWYNNYNLMSTFQKGEIEGDDEKYDDYEDDEAAFGDGIFGTIERISRDPYVRKAIDAFTLIMNLFSIYESGASVKYYYYFAGEAAGQTTIDTIILVNAYMNWFTLDSIPQYERYNPNHVAQEEQDDLIDESDMDVFWAI